MTAPDLALQKAVVARLKAAAAVTADVGDRIHDRVPENVEFPFVAIAETAVDDDGTEDLPGLCTVTLTVHVWSRGVGAVEARRIARAVFSALSHAPLDLAPDWALVDVDIQSAGTRQAEDGITTMAEVGVRALIDPAA